MVSLTLEYQQSTNSHLMMAGLTSQIKTYLLYQPGETKGLPNPVRRQTSFMPWVNSLAPSGICFGSSVTHASDFVWEKCPQPTLLSTRMGPNYQGGFFLLMWEVTSRNKEH